jgi:signal transduction histidine kinase
VKNLSIAQYFQGRVITPCLLAWQRRSFHDLIRLLEWLFLLGAILPNILLPLLDPSWASMPSGTPAPPCALGHALTAQSLQLETVQYFWHSDVDKASRSLSQARQLGSQALNDLRQTVSVLRADPLHGLSLEEAIAKLIETFHQATGVLPSCALRLDGAIPISVKSCTYRVVQEALTNIARHSQATEVSLYLQVTSDQLNILIQDNGIGFEPSQTVSGFGLQGMKERIIASGGSFSIVSQSGLGCKVMAQVPLAKVEFT